MWLSYAVVAVAICIVGGIGARATEIGPWYRDLSKPRWNPPDWVFPVVWTTIYLFIIVAVGGAWNEATPLQKTQIFWVTAINFLLNTLWSVVFFTMKKPLLALVEVLLLWLSILVMMVVLWGVSTLYGALLVPYLLWVSVAMLLNLSIVRLNPAAS